MVYTVHVREGFATKPQRPVEDHPPGPCGFPAGTGTVPGVQPSTTSPNTTGAPAGGFDPQAVSEWVSSLALDEVTLLAEICTQAIQDLASSSGDLDTLVEVGFTEGFERSGLARRPWVVGGILIVPGGRIDSMGGAHQCRFTAVGDDWVWQSDGHLADVMRPTERGLRTVTLLAAQPGLEFDVVTSTFRRGAHRRKTSEKWRIVEGGELALVERRGAGPGRDHR